jgi:hypothetical protein
MTHYFVPGRRGVTRKAIRGDNWAIGYVTDRLDGKPTEHKELEGSVDHAICIVWAGMPPLPAQPGAPQIEHEPQPALPSPQPAVAEAEHVASPNPSNTMQHADEKQS